MYYRVKIIQVQYTYAQISYSNNSTAEYTFLVDAIAAIRSYLSGPTFNLKVDQLHYYIEVCAMNEPLFNFLYLGNYQSILEASYTPFPFDTEVVL